MALKPHQNEAKIYHIGNFFIKAVVVNHNILFILSDIGNFIVMVYGVVFFVNHKI